MEEDAPASSSSGNGRMSGHEGGDRCKETRAEEEHSEDPERGDGKWMRTEGNKRKAGEGETEESRLRKTVRYLKALARAESTKEPDKAQEVVDVTEVEVNEDEEE